MSRIRLGKFLRFSKLGKIIREKLHERRRRRRAKREYKRFVTGPFRNTMALKIFSVPDSRRRISIVTDSIGKSSFFGGVATASIFAALLANRMDADLRVVTRTEKADDELILKAYAAAGIELKKNILFEFAPVNDRRGLPVSDQEYFISTSWWTTSALLRSVSRKRLIYLLQEDERMFYGAGDERLRCQETFDEAGFPVVINTKLLFDHFVEGPDAVQHFKNDGMFFEPAFRYHPMARTPSPDGRRRFFFYARPRNPRNLFWRGVEVINRALDEGILDPQKWEINFVGGADIPETFRLSGDVAPIIRHSLPWHDYVDLVKSMDAGLCLMATPHPSYPPLDLAAAGAAVLTNSCLNKTDLSSYSSNIITRPFDVDSLLGGMRDLVGLSTDEAARFRNCTNDSIQRDWDISLEPVISRLSKSLSSQ